ncbi:hypothetical protein MANES_02G056900v8 [Manihot esculenta]|uniref:Uncharacterized protein n=1 Tax=Manihot esculenta TaxID=3983 RepID=A0A2C9WBB4_MANES|nr:hypothetical protein MANES_02G056900v8 [Manihot esculenta]
MKALVITCILLFSFIIIPSPIVARELTHHGKIGGGEPEVVFATKIPICKGKQSKKYNHCRCPTYKPNC